MKRSLVRAIILLSLTAAESAMADEQPGALPRIGLAPGEPEERSASPSIPFGIPPSESKDWVLDFHGYMLLPMTLGIHQREVRNPGQSKFALHGPPLIPNDLRNFNYTGVVPTPWVQMNISYGNSTLSATTILAARALTLAAGVQDPAQQFGVSDAYLSVNLSDPFKTPLEIKVGAFTGRYGIMGQYDMGRYGTPLIARTNSIGESLTAGFHFGKATLVIDQGIGGQLARPPVNQVPAGWNDFADPNVGSSFVAHLHAGVGYAKFAELGLHYLTAWSQDDQASFNNVPDGHINVLGADLRLTAGRFGHLYVGASRVNAKNSGVVSGVIEVLNARGGPELRDNYLGPNSNGNGSLTTFGAQFDFSLVHYMYGDWFKGASPDVFISLFGITTEVKSDDPNFDAVRKTKVGAEVTYSMLSWFGLSGRFDQVTPNGNPDEAFSILSPRILFHTNWRSRDEFALQYSHFFYGSQVAVPTGTPPVIDPLHPANPDKNVISLSGTFWW